MQQQKKHLSPEEEKNISITIIAPHTNKKLNVLKFKTDDNGIVKSRFISNSSQAKSLWDSMGKWNIYGLITRRRRGGKKTILRHGDSCHLKWM